MSVNKIIRSVCLFDHVLTEDSKKRVELLSQMAVDSGFFVQTKRICVKEYDLNSLKKDDTGEYYLSIGTLTLDKAEDFLPDFIKTKNLSFNIDLTHNKVGDKEVSFLFNVIKAHAAKTFNFTFVFNNLYSSPYYPSASYEKKGFSVGLQPTDLSGESSTLDEWLNKLKQTWDEIDSIYSSDKYFLGIDTSVAPLFEGNSSLVHFLKKIGLSFNDAATTDTYIQITEYIKKECRHSVGLCGLMFPCLEDFELASEYEKGNFSIERNIFLSLHSGLGIDTYPIGIDESKKKIIGILRLIQGLSTKYNKPLSVRLVSDGKAKIGQKSNFNNKFLKDVIIRPL